MRSLHRAARTDSERVLLALMHGLGARRAEARTVLTGDILKLKDALTENRHPLLSVTGKGSKTRTVPVDKSLAAWFVEIAEKRIHDGASLAAPIVANRFGRPMSNSGVNDIMKRLCKRANLVGATPHALRRKFSDDWAQAHGKGGYLTFLQLRVLADILGHAGLGSLKHYLTPQSDAENVR
jgi:integrase